ncbi:MAG TPA: LysM peptidoglycan-binding domain-containing protein [Chitinophagaceae bacterium]|nr:LysM peptidoglycan-binding domain-containing protein [Chitinophagaceae bacterium]
MKKLFFSFFVFLMAAHSVAAQKELMVKSSDKGLYLEHKVAAKESFYAVGRLYNVSPKFIASFNSLDLKKGLQIDQKIRIPLTDTNFTQQGNVGTPVYYKVGGKEGLMTVSNKNNKVSLANLRLWNNLSKDELKEDSKLVIGFLHSNGMPAITLKNKPVQEEPTVKKEEKQVITEPVSEEAIKKAEEKEAKAEEKAEKKEEKNKPEPVVIKEVTTQGSAEQGYFKTHFEKQIKISPITKSETVTSGIFKTTSGWQDAKYYLLIDKVPPGTIIKIINPTNNNAIYAKVLGEMSGIRQNEGLNIRISNAAAAALNISDQDKFIVKVNY